jgi:hypothetical protein
MLLATTPPQAEFQASCPFAIKQTATQSKNARTGVPKPLVQRNAIAPYPRSIQ